MRSCRFKVKPKRYTTPASTTRIEAGRVNDELASFREQLKKEIKDEFSKIKEEMKQKNLPPQKEK